MHLIFYLGGWFVMFVGMNNAGLEKFSKEWWIILFGILFVCLSYLN